MSFRVDQSSPEMLTKLRSILASPTLVGSEAWDLPDEELIRKAEIVTGSFAANMAALHLASRPIVEALLASPLGRRLAPLAGVKDPGPLDELEQLMECAEAR